MMTSAFGVGDWVMLAVSAALVAAGAYFILFAARIDAVREAKREARTAEMSGAGFNPRAMALDPRVEGFIMLGLGTFSALRTLALI